jgi:hypothetical protein
VTGSLLPLPDDPRLAAITANWNAAQASYHSFVYPRSAWLHDFEAVLREHYPQASSDDLTLTARTAAPFPLALPGVP